MEHGWPMLRDLSAQQRLVSWLFQERKAHLRPSRLLPATPTVRRNEPDFARDLPAPPLAVNGNAGAGIRGRKRRWLASLGLRFPDCTNKGVLATAAPKMQQEHHAPSALLCLRDRWLSRVESA